jgi:hypothetical protein
MNIEMVQVHIRWNRVASEFESKYGSGKATTSLTPRNGVADPSFEI